MNIPDKIADYNVYDDKNKLIGVSGEVTLPNFEAMTSTLSGAGILGELETTNPGHYSSTTMEFSWRTLLDKTFNFATYSGRALILRAASQQVNSNNSQLVYQAIKITFKYMNKGLDLGKLAQNAAMESKTSLEVWYIKIEIGGKVVFELDKLNSVYKVNGQDQLSAVKKLI
ncbi:phage tail protein [Salmonella enterica subsp. enterica]|nr:phage tail protein [Salmonella enterica subsp. enterica serovar Paratyphi A]